MKRWITVILALLTATVFTACGNAGTETPDTKDPADIARDIATAEVLGDTLATAYENGLPTAEDWLDLYFMGSSDPGLERRIEVEEPVSHQRGTTVRHQRSRCRCCWLV